jgi:hypothetical protein
MLSLIIYFFLFLVVVAPIAAALPKEGSERWEYLFYSGLAGVAISCAIYAISMIF